MRHRRGFVCFVLPSELDYESNIDRDIDKTEERGVCKKEKLIAFILKNWARQDKSISYTYTTVA